MSGWIKLHRALLNDPLWLCSTDSQKVVLITLLLKANHDSSEWLWNGNKYTCQPGQLITSISSLSKESGASTQSVRGALAKFEKLGFLNKESNKQSTLITICNYTKYQKKDNEDNTPTNKEATNEQQTGNKRATTNKNVKNNKNVKKESNAPSKLTDNFQITDSMRDWFQENGFQFDINWETEKFKDYFISSGKKYVDWVRTWQNWMRRAYETQKANGNVVQLTNGRMNIPKLTRGY